MKGLLLKDIYNMQSTLKIYLVMPVLASFLSYNNGDLTLIQLMISFMGIFIVLTAFAYDEMCQFPSYALTLPLDRKDLVRSKFVLMNLSVVGAVALSLLLGLALITMFPNTFPGFDTTTFILGTVSIGCAILITCSIMMPCVFQYGTNKARVVIVLLFLAFGFVGGALLKTGMLDSLMDASMIERLADLLPYLLIGSCILIEIISYVISSSIVSKKEY